MKVVRALVLTAATTLALPAGAHAVDFKTPQRAAYCDFVPQGEVIEGGVPSPRSTLQCWTPNDGFTTYMSRTGKARKLYGEQLVHAYAPATPLLRFGQRWQNGDFYCLSESTGLTCRNARGHGWWLGRFRGYRIF
jgi:hypothetical protein